jgi:hypothetical protein
MLIEDNQHTREVIQRLLDKSIKNPDTGCLEKRTWLTDEGVSIRGSFYSTFFII